MAAALFAFFRLIVRCGPFRVCRLTSCGFGAGFAISAAGTPLSSALSAAVKRRGGTAAEASSGRRAEARGVAGAEKEAAAEPRARSAISATQSLVRTFGCRYSRYATCTRRVTGGVKGRACGLKTDAQGVRACSSANKSLSRRRTNAAERMSRRSSLVLWLKENEAKPEDVQKEEAAAAVKVQAIIRGHNQRQGTGPSGSVPKAMGGCRGSGGPAQLAMRAAAAQRKEERKAAQSLLGDFVLDTTPEALTPAQQLAKILKR
eukprot:scaffold122034_cov51-Phaeocystis_antarctica.AAC.2